MKKGKTTRRRKGVNANEEGEEVRQGVNKLLKEMRSGRIVTFFSSAVLPTREGMESILAHLDKK